MQSAITAIGIATPAYTQSQSYVLELMLKHLSLSKPEQRLLKTIYRNSGINNRYSVLEDFIKPKEAGYFFSQDSVSVFPNTQQRMKLYKENALNLALSAVHQCLNFRKDFNKNEITHLITISCTGMYAPGLDIEIVNALELASSTQRLAINFMGCYATFNGLKAAQSICQANKDAKVLLVSVELCTLHFQKEATVDNFISNAIFADGAGVMLIENNTSSSSALLFKDFYCDILSEGQQEMTWDIGNFGFDIKLSSYVPDLIAKGIVNFFERLLSKKTLSFEHIDYYGIHPGGKKILQACEQALKLSAGHMQFSYDVLKNYGNMSSATIIFVLKKISAQLTSKDHEKNLFCCAFGPGLTLESMLLTVRHV